MSTDPKRHRILAVFLATALGAALSLQLAAPASAARQPELTLATGDHLASRGTVFQGARSSDSAGIQATITCRILVSDPFRSGGDIRGAATVRCTAPVLAIEAEVALFQEGIPFAVAHDYDLQLNIATVTVADGASCEDDDYIVAAAARIVPPPGYVPEVGWVYGESLVVPVTC